MPNGSVYIGNRGGLPVVTTTPTVNTSNVVIALPNHIFRFLGAKGQIVVNFSSIIPTGTTGTLPVVISVNNEQRPLTSSTGEVITVADIATTLTFSIYFDKVENVIRVLSVIG